MKVMIKYIRILLLLVIMLSTSDAYAQQYIDYESRGNVYLRQDVFSWCWNEKESFSRDENNWIIYNGVEWGGLVSTYDNEDWSGYEKVVFEFAEPVPVDVQIYMDFGTSGDEVTNMTSKGATSAEFSRGSWDWSHVHALVLQPSQKCTLKITSVYLKKKTFTSGNLKYHELKGMSTNLVNTSLVKTEKEAWGAWWETDYIVNTADGRRVNLIEQRWGDVNQTGDLMSQEILNLPGGEYEVVLYASSYFTPNWGFESDMRDYANDVAYVFANGVKKYITCRILNELTYCDEYTIRVKVSTGRLRIGFGKDKPGTNWHAIQIKSLKLLSSNSTPSVELVDHNDLSGNLSIPSQVKYSGKTYNVVRLAPGCLVGTWNVNSVTIPEGVEEIGWQAFIYSSFTTFNISSTVQTIGDQAFNALDNNTAINVDAGNQWLCSEDGVLFSKDKKIIYRYPQNKAGDSYVIPNTVEILGTSSFGDNTKLHSVTIPQSCKDKWWGPFWGCTNLTTVICQVKTALEYSDDFFDQETYKKGTLYVPSGCVSTYKSTSPWNKFKTIKEIPSQITVTARSYEITYGDALPNFGYDVSDNSVTGTPKITCSATKTSSAGTYDINIQQGTMSSPGLIQFVKGKLTIKKAPLTISVGNYTKKQGDPMPTFKLSYSGFKNSETESVLTKKPTITCNATTTSAPGEYAITLSGATATNYSFTYKNGTLTVTKADAIVVTAKNYTITYGDAIPTLEYTTTGGTLSGKPSLSCSAGSAGSRPNAGVYDITVSKGTVSNYNVNYVKGTLTVKKAPLTVSVGDYTKSEGEDMPNFVISYSGFKKSDTKNSLTKQPVATCEANKWSPAGSYPITLSGGQSSNYDFTYKNGTLTVSRYLTLTIMSQGHGTVNYGSANVANYQSFDVKEGTSINLTFTPDNGYKLSQLTVNGEDVTQKVKDNSYSLGQLTKDMVVVASFAESTGTIRIGGITYSILSAPEKTVVVGKSTTYRGHVKIPETITRSGEEWRVVGVASNAFNNCSSLISITLPQSMKSGNMGLSLFTGCTKLAAIVWNANFMLTTSVMGTVNNPNLLFYTKSISYSPRGVDNVIVDGSADKITLQDGGPDGDNFYCPIAFTANSISYTHSYSMESAYGGVGGWETLALPFTVQQIKHERVGDIIPFAAYDSSMERRPFWLYTYSGSGFVRAASIEANVPYIICMPNNSEYDAEFLLGGKVTFSAQNATVASSDGTAQKEQPSRNNKTFVAAYKAKTRAISTDVYAMNVVNERYSETGGYTAGSIFINNLRTVAPFEAVMTSSSAASRVMGIDFNETTGIESLPAVNSNIYNVYNLNGQLLIQTDNIEELNRQVNQLPAGVYVVNGKKMIINK